jgi:alcohol dehydrogenase class IV
MLDAALCAGFAIDLAGTGIGHGVGHALASMTPIPHGLAVAFGMWSCLEWGMATASERYARVDVDGDLQRRITDLLDVIEFEHELRRWVTRELDPDAFATELARAEHRPMCLNNARPAAADDLVVVSRIVSNAWNRLR